MRKITFLSLLLLVAFMGRAQTGAQKISAADNTAFKKALKSTSSFYEQLPGMSGVKFPFVYFDKSSSAIHFADDSTAGKQLEANVALYPNPVQNKLKVQVSNAVKIKSVILYDMLGKAMATNLETDHTINTSRLSSGIYVLRLETNHGSFSKKVVKN